jgi:hypothetical protein
MKVPFSHSILTILLFQFVALSSAGAQTYLGYSDYQIATDLNFAAGPYFEKMSEAGVNFQRIWVMGYSGVEPNFDELMPFAMDRGKYRLDQIEPAYITRLQNVLTQAEKYDQRVMLTLFDHWSLARMFEKTPWFYKNNYQRLLKRSLPDFYNIQNRRLMDVQENYVREIVRMTKDFTPIYEIMNEAGGAKCGPIGQWHNRVASWILSESPDAEIAININDDCSEILDASWVDIISLHHGNWKNDGICASAKKFPEKQVIIDTDGAWKIRGDNRLVRRWLRQALACGASFNHKDDIYNPDRELLRIYRQHR